ncbi:MAG: VanZ family protein [Bacteroidota bacterium]
MPGSPMAPFKFSDLFQPDKVGHLIFYGVFVSLIFRGITVNSGGQKIRSSVIVAVLSFAIGYGFLLEVIQFQFLTDRYFDILDIIANIIGCFIGLTSLHFLVK